MVKRQRSLGSLAGESRLLFVETVCCVFGHFVAVVVVVVWRRGWDVYGTLTGQATYTLLRQCVVCWDQQNRGHSKQKDLISRTPREIKTLMQPQSLSHA